MNFINKKKSGFFLKFLGKKEQLEIKRLISPILALVLVSFIHSESQLTASERALASRELAKSGKDLMHILKGLNQEQLNFKTSASSWSISEITEHIAVAETAFFDLLYDALKTQPDPSKRNQVAVTDGKIMSMIRDRSTKVKTQSFLEPTGRFDSPQLALKEFKSKRKKHIKYVKNTEDDLRNHYTQLDFGIIDSFQILLMLSAHTDRHVLQIEEVLAHENFPK